MNKSTVNAIKSLAGITAICGIVAVANHDEKVTKRNINNLNKEIQMKDSARYNNLVKAGKTNNIYVLRDQAKKMNDSLKIDSVAKKAYFEGAQMVRDSLKKAQKVVK